MEFSKSLKTEIAPLYNLKGGDIFLIKTAINNLKSTLITDFEEFNYARLSGEKLKKDELIAQIETLPIASDCRLIVVENPNIEIVKFLNSYKFDNESCVILTINADKLTAGEMVDCDALDRKDITKYVLNYLAKSKLSIQERALDYLIDATNGDMARIRNELDKIIAYSTDLELIDIDVVSKLVANSTEYATYMLTSAIDEKNLTKFQTILSNMTKSSSVAEIYSYMGRFFRRMQYIAISKDDAKLTKILNIKQYAIDMSRKNIKKNGVKYYIDLYQKYVDLDYSIKSGKITPEHAMYELVF